jgi:endoglucanase
VKSKTAVLKTQLVIFLLLGAPLLRGADLQLNGEDYFETHGLNVLLFHNSYHDVFGDQKMGGLEIILHEQRIATNGDVRLSPTPAQWDAIPHFQERKRGPAANELSAFCTYASRGLSYQIDVQPEAGGFRVSVHLDQPLPAALAGKAGLNLEFLPTAYFGKSFVVDEGQGSNVFPRHADGPMQRDTDGIAQPLPLATGHRIVLSPEDPLTRVSIVSDDNVLSLFDGRNQAQNGWFVIRSLIPSNRMGSVVVWHVHPNVVAGWTRPPVVAYNQVGYTPERTKVAVLEFDPAYNAAKTARVLRITPDGEYREVFKAEIKPWGKWLRYQYAHFDFSARSRLRAGHASGVQCFLCVVGGDAIQTHRLWEQPSGLLIYPWRHDSWRGDYPARFP